MHWNKIPLLLMEKTSKLQNFFSSFPLIYKGEKTFACLLRLDEWMSFLKLFIWKGLLPITKLGEGRSGTKEKNILSSLNVSISHSFHFFFTSRNFLIYCYSWKGSKVSSYDGFEDCSLVEYIFLITPLFLSILLLPFSLSLSLFHLVHWSHLFFVFMGYLDYSPQW